MPARSVLLVSLAVALVVGCASPRSPKQIEMLVQKTVRAMQGLEDQGLEAEAILMARAITAVDPWRPEALAVLAGDPPDLFDRGLGGANVALRQERDASWGRRVLFYIPDRIFDFFDMWSIDLHFGIGLYFDVHVTRAFTFGGGARSVVGIGGYYDHAFGLQTQTQAAAHAVVGAEVYAGTRVGITEVTAGAWTVSGLPLPTDAIYQEYRDYWAVGECLTLVFVGVDSDVHLYQILDFFAGFVGFDPARDDWATTSALELPMRYRQLIQSLVEVASRPRSVKHFRDWLAARRFPAGTAENTLE